jgi:hypothetical protein
MSNGEAVCGASASASSLRPPGPATLVLVPLACDRLVPPSIPALAGSDTLVGTRRRRPCFKNISALLCIRGRSCDAATTRYRITRAATTSCCHYLQEVMPPAATICRR